MPGRDQTRPSKTRPAGTSALRQTCRPTPYLWHSRPRLCTARGAGGTAAFSGGHSPDSSRLCHIQKIPRPPASCLRPTGDPRVGLVARPRAANARPSPSAGSGRSRLDPSRPGPPPTGRPRFRPNPPPGTETRRVFRKSPGLVRLTSGAKGCRPRRAADPHDRDEGITADANKAYRPRWRPVASFAGGSAGAAQGPGPALQIPSRNSVDTPTRRVSL